MSSIFTKEFYEHLYRVESEYSDNDWYDDTKEPSPDLIWCQNFVQTELNKRSYDQFTKSVLSLLQMGYTTENKMRVPLHLSLNKMKQLVEEYELRDLIDIYNKFWNGIIIHDLKNDEYTFVDSRSHVCDLLGIQRYMLNRVILTERAYRGYRYYTVRDWKYWHPEFMLDEEDLKNHEVIRINKIGNVYS